MAGFILWVGDPGSGKTSALYAQARAYIRAGWRVIVVSVVDDRALPLGCEQALDLPDAIRDAAGWRDVVIAYDEVALETAGSAKTASPELEAIGRFRRHMGVTFLATTQRPHDLPATVRDLNVQWRLMRFGDTSSYAYQWLAREFPDSAGRLPHLHPYYWENGSPDPVPGTHYIIGR